MFIDIFYELCRKKDIKPTRACIEIGISKTAFLKWKDGGTPNGSTLSKIADYFHVPTDYFFDKEQIKKPAPGKRDELIGKIMNNVNRLEDPALEILLAQIKGILSGRE